MKCVFKTFGTFDFVNTFFYELVKFTGFKAGLPTDLCSYTLKEFIEQYKSKYNIFC